MVVQGVRKCVGLVVRKYKEDNNISLYKEAKQEETLRSITLIVLSVPCVENKSQERIPRKRRFNPMEHDSRCIIIQTVISKLTHQNVVCVMRKCYQTTKV